MTIPTNTHPVDSAYYPCCNAIGRHAAACATGCRHDWCDKLHLDGEHYRIERHSASVGTDAPAQVGVGLIVTSTEPPAIVVHIDGGDLDHDADAYLTLAEAQVIRDSLNRAIRNAEATL